MLGGRSERVDQGPMMKGMLNIVGCFGRHFLTVPRFRRNTFGRRALTLSGVRWLGIHYLTVFGIHRTAAVVSGVI